MMKRSITIAMAALLLASCCPCKHLSTSQRDSLRVEVRTHTEYITDTVYRDIPSQSQSVTVRDTTSHLENDYARSDARIHSDGTLFHSLNTKPQKLPVAFEKPIEYRDSIVYRDRDVASVVQVPRDLTWWQRFRINGFWVLMAAMAFILRRPILALLKPLI